MTSLRDIALRARVSTGTVDRVLHDRGRVAPATKTRVQRILRASGYRPNIYARNLSLGKTFRFAVVLPRPGQDSGNWHHPHLGIRKAVRELEAYRVAAVCFPFDRYSDRSFERAMTAALRSRPDGILLAPVRTEAAAKILRGNGLPPYALVDSSLPRSGALTTIMQDARQSGLLASHLMRIIVPEADSVAIVRVLPADYHIEERIAGFREGIGQGRSVSIIDVESGSGGVPFRVALEGPLRAERHPRGIYVSNAWTHAVARAVRALIPGKALCVVGYDLVRENSILLRNGGIDFLISQRPATQGYEGMLSLYRHVVLGRRVPEQVRVPLDILTRDNLAYYHD
jgi:LacI family transcriptional regulator